MIKLKVNGKVTSFEDMMAAVNYKIANPSAILEEIKKDKKKSEKGQSREDFMKTLTPEQISAIEKGKKKVCHSDSIGWYCKQTEENEIHISLNQLEARRKMSIRMAIKEIILAYKEEIYMGVLGTYENLDLTEDEFEETIKNLTFIQK